MTDMSHSRLTLLCSLALGLVATDADAEIVIRKSGSTWARVDDDGTIRIKGRTVGRFESNGTIRKRGSSVGSIDSDGTIRKRGSTWGTASNCCGSFGSKKTVAAVMVFFANGYFEN